MTKLKFFLLATLLLAPLAYAGCSSGGSGGGTQPDQTATDVGFTGLADASFFVSSALEADNTDCADLEAALNTLVGTFPCDGGGSTTYTLNSFDCEDGPPLSATFSFTIAADNCTDEEGNTFDGSVTLVFTGGEASPVVTTSASSAGITVNDLFFIFDSVTITLDIDTEAFVSCSGSATVDGFDCSVAGDCSACTF